VEERHLEVEMSGLYEGAVKVMGVLFVPMILSVGSVAYAALKPVEPVPPPSPAPTKVVAQPQLALANLQVLTTWSVVKHAPEPPKQAPKTWTCERRALLAGIDVRYAKEQTVSECFWR
jgi:hypothetical protein